MRTLAALLTLAGWGALALAGAPSKDAKSPLAALPSKPGPHIARIKALGDNSWLDLGAPAPDPRWGKEGLARGRSWGGRALCSASNLGGAFFCGTGVHGYVKSDGHYMDDLWFYDINAHRWICLYPGASKKTKLKLDKNGFEVNEKGEHIPVSYLSHAYGNMTYDSDRKKLYIAWAQCPWWGRAVPQRWEWLDQTHPGVKKRSYGSAGAVIPAAKHPLLWDVATGKWERVFVKGPGPVSRGAACARLTEYIPAMKKVYYAGYFSVGWLYDHKTNSWKRMKHAGKPLSVQGCHDSTRNYLWTGSGKKMAYLDFKANKWTVSETEGGPTAFGSVNRGRLTCDTASGKLVYFHQDKTLYVYDPDTNKWQKPELKLPKPSYGGMVHGCYDQKLNAHFYYLAGDSRYKGATMLAYRYKRAQK